MSKEAVEYADSKFDAKLMPKSWWMVYDAYLAGTDDRKDYSKEELIWAIQEAYGHGRDDSDSDDQVEESIQSILAWLINKRNKKT
jgi:hypothetical protein